MPPPTVYAHSPDSASLHQALKSTLPNSISLLYRIQHSYKTPNFDILSTFNPAKPLEEPLSKCWAVTYFDRTMRPETEMWIFASGERHSTPDTFCPTCRVHVLALIDHVSKSQVHEIIPENRHHLDAAREHEKKYPETGPGAKYPFESATYVRHLLDSNVVTLGAAHHQICRLMQNAGLVREEYPGLEAELNKFLFKVSNLPQTRELPEGLRWGEMREIDIPIVLSRTAIPRGVKTLLSLKSVGVFEDATEKPIAWCFLGLDGSLTTLHTEPEYRGKGIAKAVAAKIIREHAPETAVDEEGTAWSHADVFIGNAQSEAVCRSLGGEPLWRHFWVRIDVGKAGKLTELAANS